MSYNNGPMRSKNLFDEFLEPYYRQVVPVIKEQGVKVLVEVGGGCHRSVATLQGPYAFGMPGFAI